MLRLQNEIGTPGERGGIARKAFHLAIKTKCSVGERGQAPENVTGMENEVGTSRFGEPPTDPTLFFPSPTPPPKVEVSLQGEGSGAAIMLL